MGGLVGGIFDLWGGNPAQSEQNAFQDLSQYENNLGENATTAGTNFDLDILSGDPSKIAQVEAPEIKAGQDQIQQQAEENAFFGNRGGGTNASTQNAQSAERGNIINLTGELQQGAASALTGTGLNLLNQGSTNLNNQANLAIENRQNQVNDVNGIAQGVASIATGLPGSIPGEGADPYQTLYNAQNNVGVPTPQTISDSMGDLSAQPDPLQNLTL